MQLNENDKPRLLASGQSLCNASGNFALAPSAYFRRAKRLSRTTSRADLHDQGQVLRFNVVRLATVVGARQIIRAE